MTQMEDAWLGMSREKQASHVTRLVSDLSGDATTRLTAARQLVYISYGTGKYARADMDRVLSGADE